MQGCAPITGPKKKKKKYQLAKRTDRHFGQIQSLRLIYVLGNFKIRLREYLHTYTIYMYIYIYLCTYIYQNILANKSLQIYFKNMYI